MGVAGLKRSSWILDPRGVEQRKEQLKKMQHIVVFGSIYNYEPGSIYMKADMKVFQDNAMSICVHEGHEGALLLETTSK